MDPYIEECLFELLRRRHTEPARDIANAEAALASASAALARYRASDQVLGRLGECAYLASMEARTERVRAARLRLAATRDAHFIYTLPPTPALEQQWTSMTDTQRRALIARVIDCVFITKGHRPIEERITVCPAGTAPTLPRFGDRGGRARPFIRRANHRPLIPRPWSTKRVERELAEYLHNKPAWPTSDRFVADGRRRLHDQIVRHAGIACWAYHFGLPIFFGFSSREVWTEPRIRAALELDLRHKHRFPTSAQFKAHGLGTLYGAISRSGGVQRWSAELDRPLTPLQLARSQASQRQVAH